MKHDHDRHEQRHRGQWQDNEDRQFGRDDDWAARGRHDEGSGARQRHDHGHDQDRHAGQREQRHGQQDPRNDGDYTRQLSERYGHGDGGYNRGAYAQGGFGGSASRQGGFGHGMSGPPVEESREGRYRSHPRLEQYDTSSLDRSRGGDVTTMYQGGEDQPQRTGGHRNGGEPWRGNGGDPAGRGGFRGRGPKGYTRSDERIMENLCEQLAEDDDVDASDISVEVRDGVATLTGTVSHRWMKHRAEDLAEACSGVKDVENRIRVGGRGASEGARHSSGMLPADAPQSTETIDAGNGRRDS
ncbi:BON domain-containing protein [Luteimonas yindakuii]|uniref:BON domain-containing protein n=1 Tax=Luteimonas yindakuii TaxID=2565782 RepID=UPI001ABDB0C3|nr:BON domain-containing protein [Luteimonas yindakuii]